MRDYATFSICVNEIPHFPENISLIPAFVKRVRYTFSQPSCIGARVCKRLLDSSTYNVCTTNENGGFPVGARNPSTEFVLVARQTEAAQTLTEWMVSCTACPVNPCAQFFGARGVSLWMQFMEMTIRVKDGGRLYDRLPGPSITSCQPKGYGDHLLIHSWLERDLYVSWSAAVLIGGGHA